MKVGDYVRFDYHRVSTPIQIAKITETHYDSEDDSICYSTDIGLVIDEGNLVKEPSPNIIDLLETGDIIHYQNEYIDFISPVIVYDDGEIASNLYDSDGYIFLDKEIDENNIKSIVTKEQFESMEYKVGE